MAINGKKLLKAAGVASATFGVVAAIMGVVMLVLHTVDYFGLDERISVVAIFVPLFVAIVITAYKEQ
jgi:flagellar motor component MotA